MNAAKKAAFVVAAAGVAVGATAGAAFADASAAGAASHSPGVGSGNLAQVPVHIPVNLVGNTVTVIGALNPTFGNEGVND
ncbi:chaplin [Streptomyces sparsus]